MIDQDITRARTLPAAFYHDIHPFSSFKESLFRDSWHYLHGNDLDWDSANVIPLTILPDYLDEPVILSRDKEGILRCFSNVCTHRGNLLVSEPSKTALIRCRYHGRCFGLDGQCRSQKGMEMLPDFPGSEDHLQALDVVAVGPMQFGRIRQNPKFDFTMKPVLDRMSWFPFQDLKLIDSKEYRIRAHWALYVDNYLEGYHVPFVHPELNKALDPKGYEYQLFPGGALQIGRARNSEIAVFAIPDHARDAGERIYAYYWWLFPNMMWNFYPWGVSLNSVEPVDLTTTRVRFMTFLLDGAEAPDFASIHQTEMEDEAIVEQVQKGINSSYYKAGRYAPDHESAVHHFHRQLAQYLEVIGQT